MSLRHLTAAVLVTLAAPSLLAAQKPAEAAVLVPAQKVQAGQRAMSPAIRLPAGVAGAAANPLQLRLGQGAAVAPAPLSVSERLSLARAAGVELSETGARPAEIELSARRPYLSRGGIMWAQGDVTWNPADDWIDVRDGFVAVAAPAEAGERFIVDFSVSAPGAVEWYASTDAGTVRDRRGPGSYHLLVIAVEHSVGPAMSPIAMIGAHQPGDGATPAPFTLHGVTVTRLP